MENNETVKGLRELCFLLLTEVDALTDADNQEEYDSMFPDKDKARRDELIAKVLYGGN